MINKINKKDKNLLQLLERVYNFIKKCGVLGLCDYIEGSIILKDIEKEMNDLKKEKNDDDLGRSSN